MSNILVIDPLVMPDQLRALEHTILTLKSGVQVMAAAKSMGDYWEKRRNQRDAMSVFDWFLAWALRQPIDEYDQSGKRLQLFHRVQIGMDEDGDPLPPCVDFKSFCAQHLDAPYTQVVNWARNVEVYHEIGGMPWEDLIKAGEGKLNISRTYFMANAGHVPHDVVCALIGDADTCPHCRAVQVNTGVSCESCQDPMNGGVKPKTVTEYGLLIEQKRGKPDSAAVEDWRLTGVIVEDAAAQMVELSVVAFEAVQRRHQPLFIVRIPMIEANVVGSGMPEDMYDLLLQLLRRKFPS